MMVDVTNSNLLEIKRVIYIGSSIDNHKKKGTDKAGLIFFPFQKCHTKINKIIHGTNGTHLTLIILYLSYTHVEYDMTLKAGKFFHSYKAEKKRITIY